MRTIAEITKEIEQEKQRAAAKVAELEARQIENRKHLAEVNEQYLSALAGGEADESEIAILQEQLEAAERTVNLTDDTIRALSNGNPRVQALEAERFKLLSDNCEDLKQKAAVIHESLKTHYDELIKGIDELNALYHSWYRSAHSADAILKQFDGATREKFGLPNSTGEQNPIVPMISSLLIERQRAFKH